MVNLTRASHELFGRSPDERFASLNELSEHCDQEKRFSIECWQHPQSLAPQSSGDSVAVTLADERYQLNDWSFTQLCRLSGISKDTVNRLSAETASQAFRETLPSAEKPLQLLTTGKSV